MSLGRRQFFLSSPSTALVFYGGKSSRAVENGGLGNSLRSDEYELIIEEGGVGLELQDKSKDVGIGDQRRRIVVKRLVPGGAAEASGKVSVDDILVSVNGVSLEADRKEGAAKRARDLIASAPRPIRIVFRQTGKFDELLRSPSVGESGDGRKITTQLAPAVNESGYTQAEQVLEVERIEIPYLCTAGAEDGDLLEIGYVGRLGDGTVFDGSSVSVNGKGAVAGRGGDTTLYFVLGKQPAGQFPPSWDVSLLGMCVGERRTIKVPAALAYGEKGLPRRRIPPNADLYYEVRLVSINGDAQPR